MRPKRKARNVSDFRASPNLFSQSRPFALQCGTIWRFGKASKMNSAPRSAGDTFRPQLLERRARLQEAATSVSAAYLNDLIAEIDSALRRIGTGSYGLCEACHDTIEADRLERNPLVRFCLDHLSQAELLAHQQDLELATQIQSKLLPPRDIALESWDTQYRYQPVGAVGGDYCELIVLDDSDGITEAQDPLGNEYQEERLIGRHAGAAPFRAR